MKKEEYSLITKKYSKNIWRKYIKGVEEYKLLKAGDVIFVPMQGKDYAAEYLCQMLLNMSSQFKMYDIKVIAGEDFTMLDKYNCNKIAMSETFEDIADNTLWEMLYNGRISSYLPMEKKDKLTIIRPLYLIHREDITKYYKETGQEVSENFYNDAQDCQKREELDYIHSIIGRLSSDNEAVGNNVFGSVANIDADMLPGYLLAGENHDFLEWYDEKKSCQ